MTEQYLLCLLIFSSYIFLTTSSGSTYSSVGHVFTAEDARVKADIQDADIKECASQIRKLKVKSYKSLLSGDYKKGAEVYTSQPGASEIGILAQDARTVIPSAVKLVDAKKIFTKEIHERNTFQKVHQKSTKKNSTKKIHTKNSTKLPKL